MFVIKYMKARKRCTPDSTVFSDGFIEGFQFWGTGIVIGAMSVLGLVGNLISFVTIISLKKRNLFNNLLLMLTIFDTIFLLNGGIFFVQRAFKFRWFVFNLLFPKIIYPLAGISMTGEQCILLG